MTDLTSLTTEPRVVEHPRYPQPCGKRILIGDTVHYTTADVDATIIYIGRGVLGLELKGGAQTSVYYKDVTHLVPHVS